MNNSDNHEQLSATHEQRLFEIVQRVETFIEVQAERLHGFIEQAEDAGELEAAAQEKTQELEEEKRAWTEDRDRQITELQEDCRQLAEAWTRLEDQQRQVMAKAATADLSPKRLTGVATSSTAPDIARGSDVNFESDEARQSRHDAVRQFQQLRREIGKHARRTR